MLLESGNEMKIYDVTVLDPQTHGEGRSMTTTYRVDVVSSVKNNTAYIRRRYSDFQWLYSRLVTERPGAILPMIPHKRALTQEARFSEELIHERRNQLQKFMQELIANPEVVSQGTIPPSLKAFLAYESVEAFEEAKKELEKINPSASGGDVEKMMNDTSSTPAVGTKVRNLFARSVVAAQVLGGNAELEITEDEHEIETMAKYVENMEAYAKGLVSAATHLIKSTKDSSTALTDLSESTFGWLVAHRERFCPTTTNDTVETFRKVSEFAKYAAKMQDDKAKAEHEKMEEALQDVKSRVLAAKVALGKRKEFQLTYTTRMKQVESRKSAVAKLRVNGRVDKIRSAESELQISEQEATKAKDELEVVTKRVLREMDRIQKPLDDLVKKAVADYARVQVEHSKRAGEAWSKFIPHVDSVAAENGSSEKAHGPPPAAAPPVPPADSPTMPPTGEASGGEETAVSEDPFANVPVPSLEAEKDLEIVGI